jgi:hypothetical protein
MLIALFAIGGGRESPIFDLCWGIAIGCILTIFVLWDRLYRHKWHQFRARNWPQVEGEFLSGSGEIVTMMKGRSRKVAGFEASLDYAYQRGDRLEGSYTRFFRTKSEAQAFIKLLELQRILVSVSPRKPSVSCILDGDIDQLIGSLGGMSRV